LPTIVQQTDINRQQGVGGGEEREREGGRMVVLWTEVHTYVLATEKTDAIDWMGDMHTEPRDHTREGVIGA
jgi:hypothetical protein